LRETVDELSGLIRGRATLGVVEPVAIGTLDHTDLLARFHAAHPGVEISLVEAGTDALVDGLLDGSIDLALAGFGATDPDGVELLVVATTELVAAVAPGDPLAGRKSVTLAELDGRDLVGMARGTGLRRILDDACAAVGVAPRVAFEASDPHVVASIAARGLGVAIVPGSLADAYPGVEVVPVRKPKMRGRLALAWRAGGAPSPAGRALVKLARGAVSESRGRRAPQAA
jgi:DNA-binding transcriptional LysR family regulator